MVTVDVLTAYWIIGYSSTVLKSGWFGSADVLTAYWIPWIEFHSGYVRLVWLLLMYSLRTGLLDIVPQWLHQAGFVSDSLFRGFLFSHFL